MRTNQTLIIAVALLLCSAVAVQAQGIYDARGIRAMAREGGAAEPAGDVVLFLSAGDAVVGLEGMVTVQYSVPLGKGTTPTVMQDRGDRTSDSNVVTDEEAGMVMFTLPTGMGAITLTNVRLDLRDASTPVTATISGDSNAIVSDIVDVISSIEEALTVESTMEALLTRGDMGSVTVTITEAFSRVFSDDTMVLLRVSGVPDKTILTVSHAGFDMMPAEGVVNPNAADIVGNVTLNEDTTIVVGGVIQGLDAGMLELTGDGKDIDIEIAFLGVTAAADSLKLTLNLDAGGMGTATGDDLEFPIAEGMVRVMATMAPAEAPDEGGPYFTENFLPAGGVVAFTFNPATCTLLYPYVTYNPPAMVDTGIAVTNPTGFGGDALSGPITFHLYGNDSDPESYTTGAGTPRGMAGGLDENGNLAAGKTYSVLLSQLLLWSSIEGTFEGHVYVETDFTRCSGLGLVWDNNGTFSQGYIPELIADEVSAGERGRTVDVPSTQ